jgi:hypothetical protein
MNPSVSLNDEDAVTMKALASFNRKGLDVPLARVTVGYGFLVETLAKKGYIVLNGSYCTLTSSGRSELTRLAAI